MAKLRTAKPATIALVRAPLSDYLIYVNLERDDNGMLGFRFNKDDWMPSQEAEKLYFDSQMERDSNELFFYVDWVQIKEWDGSGTVDLGKFVIDC